MNPELLAKIGPLSRTEAGRSELSAQIIELKSYIIQILQHFEETFIVSTNPVALDEISLLLGALRFLRNMSVNNIIFASLLSEEQVIGSIFSSVIDSIFPSIIKQTMTLLADNDTIIAKDEEKELANKVTESNWTRLEITTKCDIALPIFQLLANYANSGDSYADSLWYLLKLDSKFSNNCKLSRMIAMAVSLQSRKILSVVFAVIFNCTRGDTEAALLRRRSLLNG
jgi:hypothetical protein